MTTPTHTHTHHTNTYRINQSDPATQNEGKDRKVARFKNEKGGWVMATTTSSFGVDDVCVYESIYEYVFLYLKSIK